mgnify:CR=1 FL=1
MLKQVKFEMFALYNQSLSLLLHTKTSNLTHKPVSISKSECERVLSASVFNSA